MEYKQQIQEHDQAIDELSSDMDFIFKWIDEDFRHIREKLDEYGIVAHNDAIYHKIDEKIKERKLKNYERK